MRVRIARLPTNWQDFRPHQVRYATKTCPSWTSGGHSFFLYTGLAIPVPPPQPTFSLVPPPARVIVRPTYSYANIDSADSSEDEDDEAEAETAAAAREEASENATAVTRFLIKHLPKQLAKLRLDKTELEEKISDLQTLQWLGLHLLTTDFRVYQRTLVWNGCQTFVQSDQM